MFLYQLNDTGTYFSYYKKYPFNSLLVSHLEQHSACNET